MYQWQNQQALPLVPGWILVPSDPWRWQEKLLCSIVAALTSTLCAALHCQSNVGSMCDCKPCWSLDLSVLVEILWFYSDHGTGPRRNGSVNSRSTLCPIESRSCLPKTLLEALIWLFTFCKLDNFFLLDLASIKTLLHVACSILWGMPKTDFFLTKSESMKSAVAFLPMHQPQ